MLAKDRSAKIRNEFGSAALPDARLTRRLGAIAVAFALRPAVGIPQAVGDGAELEATYRFLNNERVEPQQILEPHVDQTCKRANALSRCLVAHDTTELRFRGEAQREGLGPLKGGSAQGFFAHVSLVISDPASRNPLGIAALESWSRKPGTKKTNTKDPKKRVLDADRESLRWARGVEKVEESLSRPGHAVHLMDREGDAFELLAELIEKGRCFIIRASHDRVLAEGAERKLFAELEDLPLTLKREVPLSRRAKQQTPRGRKTHPQRRGRVATLGIGACRVSRES